MSTRWPRDSLASFSGTLIVISWRSAPPHLPSSFPLGLPSAHFGKELHRAELAGDFDLAILRVVGLRQPMIGGYFSDGRFQNLHQVSNCLLP